MSLKQYVLQITKRTLCATVNEVEGTTLNGGALG